MNNATINNEDCRQTMSKMEEKSVDIILTSPFYNTDIKDRGYGYIVGGKRLKRYDTFKDSMTNAEYSAFTISLFQQFDKILKDNGVVLYNLSYGNENTEGMFLTIADVIKDTAFTIADVLAWEKNCALPDNLSPNKATRIWEFVFVLCRKSETKTFKCNKEVSSRRSTGQLMYSPFYNVIRARNNDESCPLNVATFSTELCMELLGRYAVGENVVVYDPFMGTGTTAVACQKMGFNCIGSEISAEQCNWADERLKRGGLHKAVGAEHQIALEF